MKILVTGNMGYIGPSVMRQLRSSYPEAHLVGMDVGFFANCLTNARFLPETLVDEQLFVDIRDVTPEHVTGVDAIVNLAAISNDVMGQIDEHITLDINYKAGINLAAMAKTCGVRTFVFASSCSVYGAGGDDAKTEASALNPLTAYAKSKIKTEEGLQPLADETFNVTCLRFATACGMSERLRLDLVLNDFVAAALSTGKITVLSDGSPWRPLINIKDMARAIDWAIGRDLDPGGPFVVINAGSNTWNYQIKDLAEAVATEVGNVSVSINTDAPPDKRSYRVNFDRFTSLADGYQPKMDLVTTVAELRYGLQAMHFDDKDFRESNLIRLKVLTGYRNNNLISPDFKWVKKAKI